MGTTIELTTSDGHKLSAYQAEPSGAARGGVLVIQEIFGLNAHIRAVADQYAEMIECFCRSVAAGKLETPAEDGLVNMRILEQVRNAAATAYGGR